jgi:hypothetical protein
MCRPLVILWKSGTRERWVFYSLSARLGLVRWSGLDLKHSWDPHRASKINIHEVTVLVKLTVLEYCSEEVSTHVLDVAEANQNVSEIISSIGWFELDCRPFLATRTQLWLS